MQVGSTSAQELRVSSMLELATGFMVLVSVGIFLAHALDAYWAQ